MADTVGNRLGPRGGFLYESDNGDEYIITQDCSLAEAVGNDPSISALPRLRANSTQPFRPRRLRLRAVDNPAVRKEIVIGDPESSFFTAISSTQLLINGVPFETTGRSGEVWQYQTGGCPAEPDPEP